MRGLGIANPIEVAGGSFGNSRTDTAHVSIDDEGQIVLTSGMLSTGQGLETALPILLAQRLGVEATRIVYRQGDTGTVLNGHGQGGSSGLSVGGVVVEQAALRFVESGKAIAADELEVDVADLSFGNGRYEVPGTDLAIELNAVVEIARKSAGDKPAGVLKGLRPFGSPS
ncbi:molybdopterin cofactor-binding domain-containing protein [Marinivivus vitaminiproducens]|uniref:molybdopterin cofactor-binding domain-containing protein n=1 Tax=Marinivivus vitaminiproducens TaxID=3035935 RepID=UPI003F9FEEE3